MFQYLNIPQPDPDSVLESSEIPASVPSAFPSHSQPEPPQNSQPLQFAMPGLAMSLVQPEPHNSSTRFDTPVPNQSVPGFLHHQSQSNSLVHGHPRSHHQLPSSNGLSQHKKFSQPLSLPVPSQPLSHPITHAPPAPLPMLQPLSNHPQPSSTPNSQPPWHSSHNSLSASFVPTPPSQFAQRQKAQVPVEHLLYNAPNPIIPISETCQAPSVSDQLPLGRREHLPGKRHHRRREPNGNSDLPHRSPRKRQKRSFVWNFFEESDSDPNVGICLICRERIPRGRNLARNTTNLRKHLEHRHPNEYKTETSIPYHPRRDSTCVNPCSNPIESPNQSHNSTPQLNFPITQTAQSASDHLQLPADHMNNVHDRTVHVGDAAIHVNGSHPAAINGRLTHKPVEESSVDMPAPPDRDFVAPHASFADPVAGMAQFRARTAAEDKRSSFELTVTADKMRYPGYARGGGNNTPRGQPADVDGQPQAHPADPLHSKGRNVDTGLLDCLAIMELPLAASKSKGFTALFSGASVHVMFPSVTRMRASILPAQIEALQAKLRGLLSRAEKLVIVVESTETGKALLCRYIEEGFKVKHICLAVISEHQVVDERRNNTNLSATGNCHPSLPNSSTLQQSRIDPQDDGKRKLIEHVDWTIAKWDIREKVIAIVMPGGSSQPGRAAYLPRDDYRRELNGTCREGSGSSTNSRQLRGYTDASRGPGPPDVNESSDGLLTRSIDGIPVIQCLVSTLQEIAAKTFCENDAVVRRYIEPMSRGIFKAWSDSNYLKTENASARPANLSLPLVGLSLENMLDALEYFTDHFERIQAVLKKQGGDQDMDILCMNKSDLELLKEMVVPFAQVIELVQETKQRGSALLSQQVSYAIPALKQLADKLDFLYQSATGELKDVCAHAYRETNYHYERFQCDELYSCATLLDPHFKSFYFSDQEQLQAVQARVTRACEKEKRRHEALRSLKAMGQRNTTDQTAGTAASLDQFMDSMINGRDLLSSISAYVEEPVVDVGNHVQNTEDYWRSNQQKWPVLTKVALQYALIPSTCRANRKDAPLGDYKQDLIGDDPSDTHKLAFLRNNLLLVEGLSILSSR
eukprot:GFKZ01015000.1.p1 GENE.GFKZ01015000.1~~GFKZ01015000.1.p1  ORF type:complete len:1088 (+),score=131.32 GFKZ01015000.1:618-3881(+)